MTPAPTTRSHWLYQSETLLSMGLLGVLMIMLVPLPPALLDLLLACNISVTILLMLVTLSAKRAMDLAVFPSLLLLLTLVRLSLNVATTRLILLSAHAGNIVTAFGNFVVGGNLVVGLVIFLILVVIQFVVITKGAGRISEVAARFTLDAMPGKQMAIDAELNSGAIDEPTARRRRRELAQETEFYGAMDGASKFVRGDAVAGLLITAINLLGGMILGVSRGMSLVQSLTTYSILTVGDGLVTQIPALDHRHDRRDSGHQDHLRDQFRAGNRNPIPAKRTSALDRRGNFGAARFRPRTAEAAVFGDLRWTAAVLIQSPQSGTQAAITRCRSAADPGSRSGGGYAGFPHDRSGHDRSGSPPRLTD